MKCQNCGTETTDAYCHNCGQKQTIPPVNHKPKNSSWSVVLTLSIIFFISWFIKFQLKERVEQIETNKAESQHSEEIIEAIEETDINTNPFGGWTDEDHKRFMVFTLQSSNNYITNYTASPESSDWTFANFSNNKVGVTTIFTINDTAEKQTVFFVFSEENGTPISHLLLINGTEYINDGSCNTILEAMNSVQQ